ncbi:MAG: ferredoxin-thioredoxin reductase catalytic domain-containing protein [bacterium]
MASKEVSQADIDVRHEKLNTEAEAGGYHLNPDTEFTKDLVEGLLINDQRYGYPSCPCRLASGNKHEDLDVICPCDYRDADVEEFDTCYCGLYVSTAVIAGKKKIGKIPERRPPKVARIKVSASAGVSALPYPVWRCRVCGYLCARAEPPGVCPICKAKKERFEKFISSK